MEWRHIQAARDLLASEEGALVSDWGGRVPIALAYPNTYSVGMSSLAMHGLYRWFNQLPGLACERAFWALGKRPFRDDPPITLESQRPIGESAVIAFTVSFEMDYFHLIDMLRRAHVPLRSHERDGSHPLVILGGPAVSANPAPVAALADAIVIGEVEPILEALGACLQRTWRLDRASLLADLARIPGVLVPQVNGKHIILRQMLHDLDAYPLQSALVTPQAEFGDMHLIEVSRGCARGCRFCLAGYWYRPAREHSYEQVLAQARQGAERLHKVGLVGSAVSDYSRIDDLAEELLRLGVGISVSSLRVSPLSPVLVAALAQSGSRSITLAPEAGSERLRRSINKRVSHQDILDATALAATQAFQTLKLYFMIGLPGETEADIDELLALSREVKGLFGRQVVVNVTPFVPKAHTPYQRVAMVDAEVIDARLKRIRTGCQAARLEMRSESAEDARLQGILARGDRLVGEALLGMTRPAPRLLERALLDMGVAPSIYTRERSITEALPWDLIDSGIRPAYLESELRRSEQVLQPDPSDNS